MRFRISTILWLIALLAIVIGWRVDRMSDSHPHRDITGVWYYPTPDSVVAGYRETLTIRCDGTFTKYQAYRQGSYKYSGHYNISDNGIVFFHIIKKEIQGSHGITKTTSVKVVFRCRCGLDQNDNLIILDIDEQQNKVNATNLEYSFIDWHYYTAIRPEEHLNDLAKSLDKVFGKTRK